MEKAAETVVKYFHENGLPCWILKGSAVARYYPQPLRRSSGDIDVWLDGGRKKIYDFARAYDKDGMLYGVNYHHNTLPFDRGCTHRSAHLAVVFEQSAAE